MIVTSKITIPELSGDKERTLYVYLPYIYNNRGCGCSEDCKHGGHCDGRVYGECPAGDLCGVKQRFPVMYMFDGHNLFSDKEAAFGTRWELDKYLDACRVPIIVCAVECNHEGDSRLSEYSPVSFDYNGKRIEGRGKKYMDWLTGVLKPMIDKEYRTMPDRENTFIGGSSMGGLMTLYALAEYGEIFSAGVGLSPSLWVQNGEVPSFIRNASFKEKTLFYTSYGTDEFKDHENRAALFGETVRILMEKGVAVTARAILYGTHSELCWGKEAPYFMRLLMPFHFLHTGRM